MKGTGKQVRLGSFATGKEAAHCRAIHLQGQQGAIRPLPPPEVIRDGRIIRLYLDMRSTTGYKGVDVPGKARNLEKPFRARLGRAIGYYETAEEAAIAYARLMAEVQAAASMLPDDDTSDSTIQATDQQELVPWAPPWALAPSAASSGTGALMAPPAVGGGAGAAEMAPPAVSGSAEQQSWRRQR